MEGKFARKKNITRMNNELLDEMSNLSLKEDVDNYATELIVSNFYWQTHKLLYFLSIK